MRSTGIRHAATRDIPLKAVALLCALVLWVAVTFLGTRTVVIPDIPVSVLHLPPDLGVSRGLTTVTVRARVPRSFADGKRIAGSLQAFVDLAGSGLGERTAIVTVTATQSAVDVLAVTPQTLRVTLDPIVERELSVRVVPTGIPADGYRLGDVSAVPERVKVRGALGLLETLSAVEAAVPVGSATSSVANDVALTVPQDVQVTPARVHAIVSVEQTAISKNVGVRVVTKGEPAPGYWVRTVTTDPTLLTVQGTREVIERLAVADTVAVDIAGARAAVEGNVAVALPKGVGVVGGAPTVRARVDIVPLEGTKELAASVSVADVPGGLRVSSVTPGTLRAAIRGTGSAFDRVRDEDVRVVVSAAGRERGTFTVEPTVENVRTPSDVRVVSLEKRGVEITLEES